MQKIGGEDLFKRAMANVNTTDPVMIGAAAASALGVIGQLAELGGNVLAERAANKVEKPTVAKPTTTAPAGVAKEADSLAKMAGKHVLQGAGLAAAGYELVGAVQELQKNGFTPEAALKFVTAGLDVAAPEIGLSFQAAYGATRAAMEHGYGESGMTGDQWVSENITNPIFDHFHPEIK